ncbi:hypothetical protein R3P38DRAFT_922513 [Favolaschia claudopus]|uniref:Uncharacterized protein n=1 Tax=Favolaschia claudopus TaxID=2862362 RepID=A0AAW0BPH5_9AGAR
MCCQAHPVTKLRRLFRWRRERSHLVLHIPGRHWIPVSRHAHVHRVTTIQREVPDYWNGKTCSSCSPYCTTCDGTESYIGADGPLNSITFCDGGDPPHSERKRMYAIGGSCRSCHDSCATCSGPATPPADRAPIRVPMVQFSIRIPTPAESSHSCATCAKHRLTAPSCSPSFYVTREVQCVDSCPLVLLRTAMHASTCSESSSHCTSHASNSFLASLFVLVVLYPT